MRIPQNLLALFLLLSLSSTPTRAQMWTFRTPMPTPRWGLAAAVLDGKVYVMGGQDAAGNVLDVVERYDPVTDTWTRMNDLDDERFNATAAVFQGKIYLIGGRDKDGDVKDDVQVYDPATGRWTEIDDLEEKREGAAAVVFDDTLYVLGGSDENARFLGTIEFFDTPTGKWMPSRDWQLDQPRAALAAVALGDAVYVVGGFTVFGPHGPVQRYNHSDSTTLLAPLDPARGNLNAAGTGRRIYALGGRDATDRVVPTVNVLSLSTGRWNDHPPLNTGREGSATAVVDGVMLVFGGRDDAGNILSTVEALQANTAPVFTSAPVTEARRGQPYTYTITTADAEHDARTITATLLPSWLALTDHGDGTATLAGTPAEPDIGPHDVILRIDDGTLTAEQSFTIDVQGSVATEDEKPALPTRPVLEPGYPNPFTHNVWLGFQISLPEPVTLSVYDMQGRRVATLVQGLVPPGRHAIRWCGQADDGLPLADGVYLVRLRQGTHQAVRTITLLR